MECLPKYTGNMEITLASSPEVNIYMSDRIKVAEINAIYVSMVKLYIHHNGVCLRNKVAFTPHLAPYF